MTAQLLLSLSILITVHEWGHYISARIFNIRVEKFYLFFDFLFPMANVLNFSLVKFKKGDTEFGVGWFPLGGYVKIAGMVDESMDKEQMKAPAEPWEFRAKPAWQRLIVMMGGIIVNLFIGVLIFIGLTYFLGDRYIPKDYVNSHGGLQVFELGEQLGLKTGDKIVKINGKDYDDFSEIIKLDMLLSQNSFYTISRNGQEQIINIPGNFIDNFNKKEAAGSFAWYRLPPVVGMVSKNSLAERVGLREGDRFLEVNGQPVTYHDEIKTIYKNSVSDSVSFKVSRGGEVLTFKEYFKDQESIGFYANNIDKKELAVIEYGSVESIGLGAERAFGVIFLQLKAFKKKKEKSTRL